MRFTRTRRCHFDKVAVKVAHVLEATERGRKRWLDLAAKEFLFSGGGYEKEEVTPQERNRTEWKRAKKPASGAVPRNDIRQSRFHGRIHVLGSP